MAEEAEKPAGFEFPVSYDIKVIMEARADIEELRRGLAGLFDELEIPHGGLSHKMSREGKYVSFTAGITLADRGKMDLLYERLRNDPLVRFAV